MASAAREAAAASAAWAAARAAAVRAAAKEAAAAATSEAGPVAAATSEAGPAAAAAVAAAGTSVEVAAPCDSPAGATSPRRGGSGTEGPDASHAARAGVLAGAGESQPTARTPEPLFQDRLGGGSGVGRGWAGGLAGRASTAVRTSVGLAAGPPSVPATVLAATSFVAGAQNPSIASDARSSAGRRPQHGSRSLRGAGPSPWLDCERGAAQTTYAMICSSHPKSAGGSTSPADSRCSPGRPVPCVRVARTVACVVPDAESWVLCIGACWLRPQVAPASAPASDANGMRESADAVSPFRGKQWSRCVDMWRGRTNERTNE